MHLLKVENGALGYVNYIKGELLSLTSFASFPQNEVRVTLIDLFRAYAIYFSNSSHENQSIRKDASLFP